MATDVEFLTGLLRQSGLIEADHLQTVAADLADQTATSITLPIRTGERVGPATITAVTPTVDGARISLSLGHLDLVADTGLVDIRISPITLKLLLGNWVVRITDAINGALRDSGRRATGVSVDGDAVVIEAGRLG